MTASTLKPGDMALVGGLRGHPEWNGRTVTVFSAPYVEPDYGGSYLNGPVEVVRLVEEQACMPTRFLSPIVEGGKVKQRTCELHGEPLVPGEGDAVYGLWSPSAEYREARATRFPNSGLCLPQGCFYSPDWPKQLPVLMCPKCRQAETDWKPFSETF